MKLNGLNRTIRFTQNLGGSYAGLFTGASFIADFMGDDQMEAGGVTATFTRATIATVTDQDLVVRQVLSGERRKGGFRRVQNLLTFTEDFSNALWVMATGGTGVTATKTPNFGSAPDGTTTACRLVLNRGAGNTAADFAWMEYVIGSATSVPSIWIKATSGATQNVTIENRAGANITVAADGTWRRYTTGVGVGTGIRVQTRGATGTADNSIDILVWHPQDENVTGQSNQNPAEYVSVGVLSAPYQGANVDGVQYFPYLNGNTVASNVVTEARGASINGNSNFGSLPGVVGSYFSTPDSAAASITGDIDIRVKVALTTITPAAQQNIFAKWTAAGNQRAFALCLNATGTLSFYTSSNGTAVTVGDPSTASITSLFGWLRVTRASSTGAINYYTSQDGIAWSALGTPVTSTAGGIFDATSIVEVGSIDVGTTTVNFAAKIYRAQIYNGINGTLAVDFNPNSWTSGATWTSATGEVWTINGSAQVIPISLGGCLIEPAATDLLTARADARDMTTANWTLGATMTRARTSVGADGVANKATRLTGGAVAATNIITSTIVAAAASRTYSVLIKRVTGINAIRLTQDNFATTFEVTALINSSTFTLVQMEQSQLNPVFGIQVGATGDAIDVDWNQYQTGNLTGLINSRIPDTITTRNADVLTYATTGWLNAAVGTLYAEWFNPNLSQVAVPASITNAGGAEVINVYTQTITTAHAQTVVGGVTQADLSAVAITGAAVAKAVNVYQLNDFAGYANNTSLGTDAAGTLPTVTQLNIGHQVSTLHLGHYIRKVAYFPYRMNSAIAQRLTV